MLKTLDGVHLIRFQPQAHTVVAYGWYYSGEYPEFYRTFPHCPSAEQIAMALEGKAFMIANSRNEIVGLAMHFKEDETARNFETAILVDKTFQKQSYAFTALKILLNWKFNDCNLYKGKINVVASNARLCNAVETFGCTREGVPKKEAFFGGEYHNIAMYAIFKHDFNRKYGQEFNIPIAGPRLDAPRPRERNHGQVESGAVEATPGAAVWPTGAAS